MSHSARVRGLKAALNSRRQFQYKAPDGVVDHLVVGGGVVGLAIARLLSVSFPEKTTYLVERNGRAGEETSSRNSEVIHAGLYYPPNSLKESLCIRGRHLLYSYCKRNNIPFRKTQKLVVALEQQRGYVETLAEKARRKAWPSVGPSRSVQGAKELEAEYPPNGEAVPTRLLTGDEARELEPELSRDIVAALLSSETGIIDSHTFMSSLEEDILESENGELVYSTSVVRVDPYQDASANEDGWVVQVQTSAPGSCSTDTLLARTLINSSGLSAHLILNSLLPLSQRIPMYYARGSYASYRGPGASSVSHLIYPSPFPASPPSQTGATQAHAFQSLGTHLTLDLEGNIKFGPDLQWISPSREGGTERVGTSTSPVTGPVSGRGNHGESASAIEDMDEDVFSYDETNVDFWKHHLIPDESQLWEMYNAVRTYLPNVDRSKFRPDYVGIRPKLVPPAGGFQDFIFRRDFASSFRRGDPKTDRDRSKYAHGQMLTLMGIESPGLTASLAIAEKVVDMVEGRDS